MAYRVRTDSFEGPFDLLLSLVGRQKVDIGAISISEIVDQYLEEAAALRALDLEVASDFLLVAATLLEIKALSLLPSREDAMPEEVEELSATEAREWLIEQLLEYKKYKNAAAALSERFEEEGRWHGRTFGPDAEYLAAMPDFLEGVTLDALASLASHAFARRDLFLLESEHIAAKPIPVEVHVRAIYERIRNRKTLAFSRIVYPGAPKPIIVVSFLAVLELYKRGMVDLRQPERFGDIEVSFVEGSGELFLTEEQAEAEREG